MNACDMIYGLYDFDEMACRRWKIASGKETAWLDWQTVQKEMNFMHKRSIVGKTGETWRSTQ